MLLAIDTETTGVDMYHGAKPFFVTTCDEKGAQEFWEWDVNPLTREPVIPDGDLWEVEERINNADRLVLQNAKFDATALATLHGTNGWVWEEWPWEKTEDTLISGHLLASNQQHNLTDMSLFYLNVDIQPFEDKMERVIAACRKFAKKQFPKWRLAEEGLPEMPSAKGGIKDEKGDESGVESDKAWKFDTWLPRALAKQLRYKKPKETCEHRWVNDTLCSKCGGHYWWIVTREYANADSAVTVALHQVHMKLMEERELVAIYRARMRVVPVVQRMEARGVTINGSRKRELAAKYTEEAGKAEERCYNIARSFGVELKLGKKAGKTNSLDEFAFDVLKLPVVAKTKKGNRSLNKKAMDEYETTLPPNSKPLLFIRSLRGARQRGTAVTYLDGYERFWRPWIPAWPGAVDPVTGAGWYVLHPSLNPTGTDTLRFSSKNPNSQNISKKEGFNLRFTFGPAPGHEWWSCDAKNIELRLPAYECEEQELIDLFEKEKEPPYYGSEHLLNFSTVYPDIWEKVLKEVGFAEVGPVCKKRFKDTWYQWVKNGDFAVGYGAIDKADGTGTADKAFHKPGAHALLKERFAKKEELNQLWIDFADEHGYVETMPDKTVDPNHGYPLLCTRNDWGRILKTVPLNYHVQGTAMWWTMKAMIRTDEFFTELNRSEKLFMQLMKRRKTRAEQAIGYNITLQVHDELVFDFPRGNGPEPHKTNLPIMREVSRLMELSGDDVGVPTPVGIEYHTDNYSEGLTVAV